MSISFVNREVLGPIKRALLDNAGTRHSANTNVGQILSLSEAQVREIHTSLGLSDQDSDQVWNNLKAELLKLDAKVRKDAPARYEVLKDFILKNNIPHAHIIYTHQGASSMAAVKTKWIKELNAKTGSTLGNFIHLGHGILGNAVSELTVLKGVVGVASGAPTKSKFVPTEDYSSINELQSSLISDIFDSINANKQVLTKRTKLELTTDMRVSGAQVSKDYVFVLTFQDSASNLEDSVVEKAQIKAVKSMLEKRYSDARNFFTDSGSASLEEAITGVIYNSLDPKSGIKSGKKGSSLYTSNHKITETVTSKHEVTSNALTRRSRSRKAPTIAEKSPINIVSMLNAKLPDEIRKRMNYPRLVNRTGRFSDSVRVISQDTTAKGGTSFAYTYQKNPYQLFESGRSRLATPERNPRTIIDESIRYLAAKYMEGRFFTRRV